MVYELTYCSLAKPSITADEILAILESAGRNNKKNKITGCLLYYNHEFLQILEGEEKMVKAVQKKNSQGSETFECKNTGRGGKRGKNI